MSSSVERCPSCGAITPTSPTGATHQYLVSSAGCWAVYGEVLAREYSDVSYMSVHSLTVDAYSAQHPGVEGPQTISSINTHLASLMAYFEDEAPLSSLAEVKSRMTGLKSQFRWPSQPASLGDITVMDALAAGDAESHRKVVVAWAKSVFLAWEPHHGDIRELLRSAA